MSDRKFINILKKRERHKIYYLKNREKILEKCRKHYQENREHHLKISRKWKRENKQRFKYIDNLLDSIKLQTYGELELILYDNGSTDGSLEYILRNYPNIYIIRNITWKIKKKHLYIVKRGISKRKLKYYRITKIGKKNIKKL